VKLNYKKNIKRYLNLMFGIFLLSLAFNLFFVSNNLVAGGVSGLGIIINEIYGVDIPVFILITNIVILLISFMALGKKQTIPSILGTLLFPLFIWSTSYLVKYINLAELDIFIQSIIGGIMSGVGLGLIFKEGLNTGGTDNINIIANQYANIGIGNAMLITDLFIVVSGGIIFGLELMAYSIISTLIITMLATKTMLALNDHKTFYIRTNQVDEVKEYLVEGLKYDTTVFNVVGGYKKEKGKMIMTVVKDGDYYKIRKGILEIDSKAFITITNSYETSNSNKSIRKNQ